MADGAVKNQQPIIIKKVKGHGHGHHGGAWKVAYADFVTAMMAFFLLLWLLNATTEEQRKGIADYFSPESLSSPNSGAGGILGGKTVAIDGSQVSAGGPSEGGISIPLPPQVPAEGEEGADGEDLASGDGGETDLAEDGTSDLTETGTSEFAEDGTSEKPENGIIDDGDLENAMAAREQEQFEAAAETLRQAIESVPELVALQDSLLIEQTPEGLRIQLVDQKGYSMFALGSAQPNQQTRELVQLVTRAVEQLPHKISISGYTDSRPYRSQDGYTNWELSSDRANAARRLLIESGLGADRIALVQGRADTDPLLPEEPESERNRRISIVLLRENSAPVEIQDTLAPSELGATEPDPEPAQRTDVEDGNAPG
ncbi:MAG: OmpA family protein [Alphaproteobacteria bacterium]|nr:OmpA family protein [Alphaproteobacteria bacterium]